MLNKFKFPIDPDRTYTLNYGDCSADVSGKDILGAFRRSVYLDKLIFEMEEEQNADSN
jgi:hypothetical protein